MRPVCSTLLLLVTTLAPALRAAASPFSGRWDLTIMTSSGAYPSWMELADEAGHSAIRLVGRVGSVHAVSNATVTGSRLTFDEGGGRWEIAVKDRKLTGRSPAGELTGV